MSVSSYIRTHAFRQYLMDWVVVAVLLYVFFAIVEVQPPFFRQFKLLDPTLQHPFATHERVSDNQLYVVLSLVPTAVIVAVGAFAKPGLDKLHWVHLLVLGLWLSLAVNGVVTDILKNLIGRPRPDFLERCGAVATTPLDTFVDVLVCTAPLGQMYLKDGMKSTPSGHSSIAFSGLFYLTLWLVGTFDRSKHVPVLYYLLALVPSVGAGYIALSRTQDYRHHFLDILLGSLIGIVVAGVSYLRFLIEKRRAAV